MCSLGEEHPFRGGAPMSEDSPGDCSIQSASQPPAVRGRPSVELPIMGVQDALSAAGRHLYAFGALAWELARLCRMVVPALQVRVPHHPPHPPWRLRRTAICTMHAHISRF